VNKLTLRDCYGKTRTACQLAGPRKAEEKARREVRSDLPELMDAEIGVDVIMVVCSRGDNRTGQPCGSRCRPVSVGLGTSGRSESGGGARARISRGSRRAGRDVAYARR
jgi:hypothetical protein